MRNTYTAVSRAEYKAHRGQLRHGTDWMQDTILWGMNASGRPCTSGGIVNDRKVRGGTAASLHAVGRAGDIIIRSKADGFWLFFRLIDRAAYLGLDEVIFWGYRWDATSGKVKRYFGINQHRDHVHWAIDPATADTTADRNTFVGYVAKVIFG